MSRLICRCLFSVALFLLGALAFSSSVSAATCTISADQVIDDTFVDAGLGGGRCDVLDINGPAVITWSGTIDTGGSVDVRINSGTVTFDGPLDLGNVGSSVTVASGATITHAAENPVGVQITANDITVAGSISADSKGCRNGYGPNLTTGICAAGQAGSSDNYGGAGYGGRGSSGYFSGPGASYGAEFAGQPTYLGSGTYRGSGYAGGRVTLTLTGTLTVDGTISANAATGASGASGGSIYIITSVLAGGGTIHANGGDGEGYGYVGGGGGGRIAIYYDATSMDIANTAIIGALRGLRGTGGGNESTDGSTYLLDRRVDDGAGNIQFTGGGTFFRGGDFIRNSISVSPGSVLECDTGLTSLTVSTTQAINWSNVSWFCAPTAATSLALGSNSSITLSSFSAEFAGTMGDASISGASLSTSGITWNISGADTLSFNVPSFTNTLASTMSMTKSGSYTSLNTVGALTLNNFTFIGAGAGTTSANGGGLFFPPNIALTFTNAKVYANVSSTLASLSLDADSLIAATGKGCQSAHGPSASNVCTSGAAGAGVFYGGAGYGGAGGSSYASGPGAAYGSSTHPILFGSGSGERVDGVGGGRVLITTTGALTVDGSISANGSGLGGSGGSVYLIAGNFSGSGSIAANGSNGDISYGYGGGGGGGRIAMVANNFTFSGSSSTTPGVDGGAMSGTIYRLQYVAPTTPSLTAPFSDVYNVSRTPTLTGSTYTNSPYRAQTSADWKITSDALGATTVWSSLGDTSHLSSITVNGSNGTFSGALLGQASLAASTTYYGFVRYTNAIGSSAWSSASTFTTLYQGASSTKTYEFDDATPSSAFAYDPSFVEINDAGNGYARLKDLGSDSYAFGLGYSPSYTKMQKLTITNQIASDLTDFQTKITVTYDADMQADFDDIRFTSSDGFTDIPFWLESKTNGDSATFYVKVPFLPSLGTAEVYLYYGNAGASSASSGVDTFDFFDDFNDGDAADWVVSDDYGDVGDIAKDVVSGKLHLSGTINAANFIASLAGTLSDYVFETEVTPLDANAHDYAMLLRRVDATHHYIAGFDMAETANRAEIWRNAGSFSNLCSTVYTNNQNTTYKWKTRIGGSSIQFYVNDILQCDVIDAALGSGTIGFHFDPAYGSAPDEAYFDNVRVRQYAATEPTVGFDPELSNASPSSMSIVLIDNGSLAGYAFIHRMEETLMPGSTGAVQYQLSADGITWKYWNGSAWTTASTIAGQTNSASTVNDHLPLFSQQVGGGDLYVRILLTSDGTQPVGLDALTFYYLASNGSPAEPGSLGPTSLMDGSTTGTRTPMLSFDLSDPDGADTLKYQIQIDDTEDFSSPVVDYTSALDVQGPRTFQVGQSAGSGAYEPGLDLVTLSDGPYYWRVKAIDNNLESSSFSVGTSTSNPSFIVDATSRYLSFESISGSGLESVTATSVRILLNTVHFENVTTTYSIISASTTATGGGVDYTLSTGVAVIVAGQTSTTIPLTIVNDLIDEPNETIGIQLSSPINAMIGSNTTTLYTILDDDTAGVTVVPTTVSVTEGSIVDHYNISLDSQPTSTVRISFATSTGGVTLDAMYLDFTSSNWATPQTVLVTATDDTIAEGMHTTLITHTASVPSGSAFGYSGISIPDVTATVVDNDSAGVSLSKTSASVTEGGATDSYDVVLTTAPTTTVEVTLTPSDDQIILSASLLTFTTSNWSIPQTVTITATNDQTSEPSKTTTITHTVSSSGLGYTADLAVSSVSVSVTDNDVVSGGGGGGGGAISVQPVALAGASGVRSSLQVWVNGSNASSTQTTQRMIRLDFNADPATVKGYAISLRSDFSLASIAPYTSSTSYLLPDVYGNYSIYTKFYSTTGEASAPIVRVISYQPSATTTPISDVGPVTPVVSDGIVPSSARNASTATRSLVEGDAKTFKVNLSFQDLERLAVFVEFGTSKESLALGFGERRAVIRDVLDTIGRAIPTEDIEKLIRGETASRSRNLAREQAQLLRSRVTFRSIYGHDPNFKSANENLAWNTLMYRIRFPRNIEKEKQGITKFKQLFHKAPTDPFQWAVVRVLGYVK